MAEKKAKVSAPPKAGPNPGTIVYPYTPVPYDTAVADDVLEHHALAVHVTSNLVTLNWNYTP